MGIKLALIDATDLATEFPHHGEFIAHFMKKLRINLNAHACVQIGAELTPNGLNSLYKGDTLMCGIAAILLAQRQWGAIAKELAEAGFTDEQQNLACIILERAARSVNDVSKTKS